MIEFLAGALTFAYFLAGIYFLRFWKKTSDRLFLHFAIAFCLMALNQTMASYLGAEHQGTGYTHILRVLAFVLILVAIVDKNTFTLHSKKS